MKNLTPFGATVKKRLIDERMTQSELAARIGVTKGYLSMILNGERMGLNYIDQIRSILSIKDTA